MVVQKYTGRHPTIPYTKCNLGQKRPCLGRIKRKNAFEQAQNAHIQIVLRMRKISPGRSLSIPFYPMVLLADSEGPNQTADAQADLGLRCSHMPEDLFSHGADYLIMVHSYIYAMLCILVLLRRASG